VHPSVIFFLPRDLLPRTILNGRRKGISVPSSGLPPPRGKEDP
jgi:hypothetical protein